MGFGWDIADTILFFLGPGFLLVLFLCGVSIIFRGFSSCTTYPSFVTLVATSHGAG